MMDNLNRDWTRAGRLQAGHSRSRAESESCPRCGQDRWPRNLVFRLGRLTRVFLSSAAALCVLMMGVPDVSEIGSQGCTPKLSGCPGGSPTAR